jgi:hypothetical protein
MGFGGIRGILCSLGGNPPNPCQIPAKCSLTSIDTLHLDGVSHHDGMSHQDGVSELPCRIGDMETWGRTSEFMKKVVQKEDDDS